MKETQLKMFRQLLERAGGSLFYQNKFANCGVNWQDIRSYEDIQQLPFTTKEELRQAYPLGLMAMDESRIVRIHSSSGTTGKPIIIPYTQGDVDAWAEMMKRCYEFAGVTNCDRIQITPGYGLWTTGIGFQNGAEKLGALCVPMGPGNTERQLRMMEDLQTTVLCATSSYALLLAEEVTRLQLKDRIRLRTGVIGSERWGDKMRERIHQLLDIELFDIYGLTEIYGPGISIDCHCHTGLHYWDDYLLFEIIDPATGKVLPEGELGELVITTLRKEGAPLIRYRTRDLTRLIPGDCPCGSPYPRHDRILGRTDDMIKIKGVNVYPGQIEEVLSGVEGSSSEYQIVLDTVEGRNRMTLRVEGEPGCSMDVVAERITQRFQRMIGFKIMVEMVHLGELPRSEKKSTRVIDRRGE